MRPRNDSRYVCSNDPRAVLRAWAYSTMDMGGWTDDDEDAFIEAVEDEHRYGTGEYLDHGEITIEAIEPGFDPNLPDKLESRRFDDDDVLF